MGDENFNNLQTKYMDERFTMMEKLFVEKLDRLHDLQEQTLKQTKLTNGRVTKLEGETEVIRFIAKRRWALAIVVVLAYAIAIKELRDMLIGLIF